jgi:hypothetical protein
MIHTRIQLDPGAAIRLREGADGTVEICIVGTDDSEASAVIELYREQLDAIRQGEIHEY